MASASAEGILTCGGQKRTGRCPRGSPKRRRDRLASVESSDYPRLEERSASSAKAPSGVVGPAAQPPVAVASLAFDRNADGRVKVRVKGVKTQDCTGFDDLGVGVDVEGDDGANSSDQGQSTGFYGEGEADKSFGESDYDDDLKTLSAGFELSDETRAEDAPTRREGEGRPNNIKQCKRGPRIHCCEQDTGASERSISPPHESALLISKESPTPVVGISRGNMYLLGELDYHERRRRRKYVRQRDVSQKTPKNSAAGQPAYTDCDQFELGEMSKDGLALEMDKLRQENKILRQQHQISRFIGKNSDLVDKPADMGSSTAYSMDKGNGENHYNWQKQNQQGRFDRFQHGEHIVPSMNSSEQGKVQSDPHIQYLMPQDPPTTQWLTGGQIGLSMLNKGGQAGGLGPRAGIEVCLPRIVVEGGFLWKISFHNAGMPRRRWFQIKLLEGLLTNKRGRLVIRPRDDSIDLGDGPRRGNLSTRGKAGTSPSGPALGPLDPVEAAYPLTLIWLNPGRDLTKSPPRELQLWEVTNVTYGHKTPAFWQQAALRGAHTLPMPELCFSLISGDRTLDLAAESVKEARQWVSALASVTLGIKRGDFVAQTAGRVPPGLGCSLTPERGLFQPNPPVLDPNCCLSLSNSTMNCQGSEKQTVEARPSVVRPVNAVEDEGKPRWGGGLIEEGCEQRGTGIESRTRSRPGAGRLSPVSSSRQVEGGVGTSWTGDWRNNPVTRADKRKKVDNKTLQTWRQRLFLYLRQGRTKAATALFDEGCPIDLMEPGTGDTALMLACRLGAVDLVKECLDRGGHNDPHPKFGQTALQAAVAAGREDCAKKILDVAALSGANTIIVNHEDPNQETPLHVASSMGYRGIVEVLLHHGANLKLTGRRRTTSLHVAAARGHREVLACLLDAGGDVVIEEVDERGERPLHVAAAAGHTSCVKLLLETAAEPNMPDSEGHTPYILASNHGHLAITRLIQAYVPTARIATGRVGQDLTGQFQGWCTSRDSLPRPHATGVAQRSSFPGDHNDKLSRSNAPSSHRPSSNTADGSLFDGLQVYVVGERQPLGPQRGVLGVGGHQRLNSSALSREGQGPSRVSTNIPLSTPYSEQDRFSTATTDILSLSSFSSTSDKDCHNNGFGEVRSPFPSARTLARIMHFSREGVDAEGMIEGGESEDLGLAREGITQGVRTSCPGSPTANGEVTGSWHNTSRLDSPHHTLNTCDRDQSLELRPTLDHGEDHVENIGEESSSCSGIFGERDPRGRAKEEKSAGSEGSRPFGEDDGRFLLVDEGGKLNAWHVYYSQGYPYYINQSSGHSQWEDPRSQGLDLDGSEEKGGTDHSDGHSGEDHGQSHRQGGEGGWCSPSDLPVVSRLNVEGPSVLPTLPHVSVVEADMLEVDKVVNPITHDAEKETPTICESDCDSWKSDTSRLSSHSAHSGCGDKEYDGNSSSGSNSDDDDKTWDSKAKRGRAKGNLSLQACTRLEAESVKKCDKRRKGVRKRLSPILFQDAPSGDGERMSNWENEAEKVGERGENRWDNWGEGKRTFRGTVSDEEGPVRSDSDEDFKNAEEKCSRQINR